MSKIAVTNRTPDNLKPSIKPYFLRDATLKGFGVRVNPSGLIRYIAEVKHKGRASRKTLGQ